MKRLEDIFPDRPIKAVALQRYGLSNPRRGGDGVPAVLLGQRYRFDAESLRGLAADLITIAEAMEEEECRD